MQAGETGRLDAGRGHAPRRGPAYSSGMAQLGRCYARSQCWHRRAAVAARHLWSTRPWLPSPGRCRRVPSLTDSRPLGRPPRCSGRHKAGTPIHRTSECHVLATSAADSVSTATRWTDAHPPADAAIGRRGRRLLATLELHGRPTITRHRQPPRTSRTTRHQAPPETARPIDSTTRPGASRMAQGGTAVGPSNMSGAASRARAKHGDPLAVGRGNKSSGLADAGSGW